MKRECLIAALGMSMLAGCETDKEKKKEIDHKLKELRETPKTNDLPRIAMCYDMAIKPARIETIDPVTGLKTLSVKHG